VQNEHAVGLEFCFPHMWIVSVHATFLGLPFFSFSLHLFVFNGSMRFTFFLSCGFMLVTSAQEGCYRVLESVLERVLESELERVLEVSCSLHKRTHAKTCGKSLTLILGVSKSPGSASWSNTLRTAPYTHTHTHTSTNKQTNTHTHTHT
jgi:hypothetical protein